MATACVTLSGVSPAAARPIRRLKGVDAGNNNDAQQVDPNNKKDCNARLLDFSLEY